MTDDHGLGVDQDAAAMRVPVQLDRVHMDALEELRETGHIMGPWWPKSRTEKSRVCIIRGCHKVDVMGVRG